MPSGRVRCIALAILLSFQGAAAAWAQTQDLTREIPFEDMTPAEKTAAKRMAKQQHYDVITFCADPGNMPLSDQNGEGFQNKIAEVVAHQLGARAAFFWRPYLERGLTRETFANKECDILIEVPAGYGNVLTTVPIYRSTYVFATRSDAGFAIDGFDDPDLRTHRIGVFQHSGMREALRLYGIKDGLDIHVISHDADLRPENQPWQQVQKVIDGRLDIAAVWGPFAGWLLKKGEPLILTPANLMEDAAVLEFSLAFGVRTNDVVMKYALDDALMDVQPKIRQILDDFGVPLVACSNCIVDGSLPSHGSFLKQTDANSQRRFVENAPRSNFELDPTKASPDQLMTVERVREALREGADVDEEFANAVLASDTSRAAFLLQEGAKIDRRDKQGSPALITAARNRDVSMMTFLLDHGADISVTDASGWNVMQHVVLRNHVPSIQLLAARGFDLSAKGGGGLPPLAVAVSEGMRWAASALIAAGAPPDERFSDGDLTALMVLATQGEAENRDLRVAGGPSVAEIAQALVGHGADVNARSKAGITPLMIAAGHGNSGMIAVLVKAGADPQTVDAEGRTALDIARLSGSDPAVKALRLFMPAN